MDFGNNFAVTMRHNFSFSGILKNAIRLMVFLALFSVMDKEQFSKK